MLRGLCREFGIPAPLGAKRGLTELRRQLAQEDSVVPISLRTSLMQVLQELEGIDRHLVEIDSQLRDFAKQSAICQRLQKIPGIGLIASTAFAGAVGDIGVFRSSRRFASWLGLTPREHSSGNLRRLGSEIVN